MKLQSVRVTEFRSVLDSTEFQIGDVTCLVGKNESGKTALLDALYRLHPVDTAAGNYDVTDDYPRFAVSDYESDIASGKRTPATVCRATFTIHDEDIEDLVNDYGDVLSERTLQLTKGYENKLRFTLHVSEQKLCAALIAHAQLPAELASHFSAIATVSAIDSAIGQLQSEENEAHLQRLAEQLLPIKKAGGASSFIYNKYISQSVPRFLYFGDYWLLKGQENIEALKQRQSDNTLDEADYPLLGLVELAKLDLDALLNPERTQDLKNKLEGAGNKLTRDVMKYWSQNKHLSTRFDIRPARPQDPDGMRKGTNFWADIYDSKHLATTSLGRRSKGFVWFFSFLAYFSQQKKQPHPLILLLDEPGLSLHGTAQADLLRYIEAELKPDHQVIYTTHSPFLVDAQHFDRVRLVQDVGADTDDSSPDEDGTKVVADVLEATSETLFPLQGALGYEIHQTLFVGPNMLVVEGPSDLLYLQAMTGVLTRRGRVGLSDAWTIVPVGGAGRVPAFLALLNTQKRTKVAALLDIGRDSRQMIDDIVKSKLLKKSHILEIGGFCVAQEADIEDLFDREFYVELVAAEFKEKPFSELKKKGLTSKAPRVLLAIAQTLGVDGFNHYRPARLFTEQLQSLEKKLSDETLDRFEQVFKAVNSLLTKS